ncbi:hypothetical protein, partial [Streptomyces chryseus]
MQRTAGLPDTVTITSLSQRDDAYAVLCLPCGGGAQPTTVQTCRGEEAKRDALAAALLHAEDDARRHDTSPHIGQAWQRATALQWSEAQADLMGLTQIGHLHHDPETGRFYRRDYDNPRVTRGRAVAKARVQTLMRAGFLYIYDDVEMMLTADGHAALRAWIDVRPEPVDNSAESAHLRPLIGGQEEKRRAAESAKLAARRIELDEQVRRAQPAAEPAAPAAPEPEQCPHTLAWLYLTADRITGRLGYHLACACGQERVTYPGNSPAMNTGTATRPLGIRDAATDVARHHADRHGHAVTGRWEILDEHTKRAAITAVDDTRDPLAAVDDPARRTAPAAAPHAAESPEPLAVVDDPARRRTSGADQPADIEPPATPAVQPVAEAVRGCPCCGLPRPVDESGRIAPHMPTTKALTECPGTGLPQPPTVEPAPREAAAEECDHRTTWLYVQAEQPARHLRVYLTCACGRQKLGNFHRRTATLAPSRSIEQAPTRAALSLADRNSFALAGPWTVLDENTKRAAVRWTLEPASPRDTAAPLVEQHAAYEAAKKADPRGHETVEEAAAAYGTLPIAGPGIVGPGTHVEYLPAHRPGPRARHGHGGVVVSLGRKTVKWLPYQSHKTVRSPLTALRA